MRSEPSVLHVDLEEREAVGLLGQAHGAGLWHLAHARDDRPGLTDRADQPG